MPALTRVRNEASAHLSRPVAIAGGQAPGGRGHELGDNSAPPVVRFARSAARPARHPQHQQVWADHAESRLSAAGTAPSQDHGSHPVDRRRTP